MNFKQFKKQATQFSQLGFRIVSNEYYSFKYGNQPKIFCIGRNKTGTTSLHKAFLDLGYRVGNQREAELIFDQYVRHKEFEPLVKYCRKAQVFQDVPFSHLDTLPHIDKAFPNSKFILSVRSNADAWYDSLVRFHIKLFGVNGNLPDADTLKKRKYVRAGYIYENIKRHYQTPDDDLYQKETLIAHYERHNCGVIDYFKDRPNDLLIINLSDKEAYAQMTQFLSIQSPFNDFPWENKT